MTIQRITDVKLQKRGDLATTHKLIDKNPETFSSPQNTQVFAGEKKIHESNDLSLRVQLGETLWCKKIAGPHNGSCANSRANSRANYALGFV